MRYIYLVRHGQASLGALDYDRLSDIGLRQASLLGAWLHANGVPLARAICGQPRRHIETAKAILAGWPAGSSSVCQLTVDSAFDEFDPHAVLVAYDAIFAAQAPGSFGPIGDMTAEDFRALFTRAFNRWVGGSYDSDYPVPWQEFKKRCLNAFEEITNRVGEGAEALVVSSAGPIAAICQHYLQTSNDRVDELRGQLFNTSVTRFAGQPGALALMKFNEIPHLATAANPDLTTLL